MTDIIESLKSGKCLCLVCKKVQNPGWYVYGGRTRCGLSTRDPHFECRDGCEYYDDGYTAAAVTWDSIQYGELTPDEVDNETLKWVEATYPELLIEVRKEA